VADSERYVPRAAAARRESKYVEFKEQSDTAFDGEWLELFKDIVAIANSSRGVLVIGVRKDGTPSGFRRSACAGAGRSHDLRQAAELHRP
jgi:predicted HTH transcriptional regulator